MATLQKIRNRGKILIATVGLALFAFIAEEFVRSLSYTQAESHQRVGKIYGEKINVQDFNASVEEYADVVKFSQGLNTLNDDQLSMIRDQVWQSLVNEKMMQHECEKSASALPMLKYKTSSTTDATRCWLRLPSVLSRAPST